MATQNPPGSSDPRDLVVNAGALDVLVTSTEALSQDDRLGVPRKTWHGMEVEFDQAQGQRADAFDADQADRSERFVQMEGEFDADQTARASKFSATQLQYRQAIRDTGLQVLGDYAAEIQFTDYNQAVRDGGEFWKPAAATVLPYTTTGAGMPEDGAFVSVGDAVLRQELANPAIGATAIIFNPDLLSAAISRTLAGKVAEILSVKDFGATGDGITDDSDAIKAACNYAIARGRSVYVPSGVYICRPNVLLFDFSTSVSRTFSLFGDGPTSVLKMADGVIANHTRFFDMRPAIDMDVIEIEGILFDNNARGSAPPSTPYGFEQSHCVRFAGEAGTITKLLRYQNVIVKDPVADGMNNQGTGLIGKWVIDNCAEFDRSRKRSSIQMSRVPLSAVITGFTGFSIEAEALDELAERRTIQLSNCNVESIDIAMGGRNGLGQCRIENTVANSAVHIGECQIQASNSRLPLSADGRWNRLAPGSRVRGCEIIIPYNSETGAVTPFWPYWSSYNNVEVEFDDCDFIINSSDPSITPTGALIDPKSAVSVTQVNEGYNCKVTVKNSRFDERCEYSVRAVRCGEMTLIDNDYAGRVAATLYAYASAGSYVVCNMAGGSFYRVQGAALSVDPTGTPDQTTTIARLILAGIWRGVTTPLTRTGSAGLGNMDAQLTNSRLMPLVAIPTAALRGDQIQALAPTAGRGRDYLVTVSSVTAPTLALLSQAGVARGTTANRPSLSAHDAGLHYLDTTLASAGKPIWWTGTAWVDTAGVAS